MKQRVLKSLGITVPQIALGTVELGLPYGLGVDGEAKQPTYEQAGRLVHAALDKGIRFIDTARAYGNAKEVLGRCLAGRRSDASGINAAGRCSAHGASPRAAVCATTT